jgi:type II secretory pathway pseudopilin PulG
MELLVVMAILSVLGTVLVIGIPRMLGKGDELAVQNLVTQLAAALEAYSANPRNGDFPPTVLDPKEFPGVGVRTNFENCGIESVVLCLNRRGTTSAMNFEGLEGVTLENLDQDRTKVALTNYGPDNTELYELVDLWGTPIAYFHHRDYSQIEPKRWGVITTEMAGVISCAPWKNPKTRNWFMPTGFQLISAGPDGEFNTEDDVTNFSR